MDGMIKSVGSNHRIVDLTNNRFDIIFKSENGFLSIISLEIYIYEELHFLKTMIMEYFKHTCVCDRD